MKISFILISCLLLFTKCQKDDSIVVPTLANQEFEIALNESVTIQGSKADELGTIEFSKLEDSRCPAGVVCIWSGVAIPTFRIKTDSNKDGQTIQMLLGETKFKNANGDLLNDTIAVELANKAKYLLILKKVTPYPDSKAKPKKAKATLKIKMQ